MSELPAAMLVFLAGVYLVGLAAISFVAPARAAGFLQGFAGSAFAHYLELIIRLIVGGAFLTYAPRMMMSSVFIVFGWVLIISTAGLFAIPWRWHHRFAQRSVPRAIRHLRLVGIASLVFGGAILAALFRGTA